MSQKLRYSEFADRIDVEAFEAAIGFVPIAHNRGEDIGYCMFPEAHKNGDTTGKFAINPETKLYNCYVCGGGSLLSLTVELLDMDVEQATEWLYQFTHGEQKTDDEFADYLIQMLEDVEERVEKMPFFNDRVLERFNGPTEYFRSRGISQESIRDLGLRYSETVLKAAPIKRKETGEIYKTGEDYVGPASIWPHYWRGKLVGWQYRWHDWDQARTKVPQWLPKWTNTTDFPKATTLYNYDAALRRNEPVVVCESLGTVAFLDTWGVPAVAWFGSKPTDQQLRLLRRFSRGVVLAPDNDSNKAGDQIYRAAEYLEPYVPVCILDKVTHEDVGAPPDADGLDLNDYAHTEDPYGNLFRHLTERIQEVGIDV